MTRRLCTALCALALLATVEARAGEPAPCPCSGDCNRDERATINEVVKIVGIVLGIAPLSACACPGECQETTGAACILIVLPIGPVVHLLEGCPS